MPDFPATKAPTAKADPAKTGLGAHSGTDAFIMQSDGKGWLFAISGCKEGPLPEHYEPLESPVKNQMSSVQNNPVVKLWNTDADQESRRCDRHGGQVPHSLHDLPPDRDVADRHA